MNYITLKDGKPICNHPEVLNISESGGLSMSGARIAYNITLELKDETRVTFSNKSPDIVLESANQFLSTRQIQ